MLSSWKFLFSPASLTQCPFSVQSLEILLVSWQPRSCPWLAHLSWPKASHEPGNPCSSVLLSCAERSSYPLSQKKAILHPKASFFEGKLLTFHCLYSKFYSYFSILLLSSICESKVYLVTVQIFMLCMWFTIKIYCKNEPHTILSLPNTFRIGRDPDDLVSNLLSFSEMENSINTQSSHFYLRQLLLLENSLLC